MFGFSLLFAIPALIVLYGLVALAIVAYGAHRKNAIVPSPVLNPRDLSYIWEYSQAQKSEIDKWECVQIFSFIWPVEIVVSTIRMIFSGIVSGLQHLVNSASSRSHMVAERKKVLLLEEERERLLSKPHPNQTSLASIEAMLAKTTETSRKAISA